MSKIKIGFDAKRLFLNHSGLGNYSRNLIHNLLRFFPENEYLLFTPKIGDRYPQFTTTAFKCIQPSGFFDKIFTSHWRSRSIIDQINAETPDVFHGLSNELPFTIGKFKGKKIVTIHDLIFMRYPGFYSAFDRINYKKKVLNACQMADTVIAISKQTKNDLVEYLKIDERKIVVVYQSCEDVFWDHENRADHSVIKNNHLPDRFLLYVGTIEPRKNLLKLVNSLKFIDMPLVVVGRLKSSYGNQILRIINENKLNKKIIFLKHVSNEHLASLYKNATCLVYPSCFEGFGIPVLEAMVCGCPVITGNNSSLIEVGGNAVTYIDVNKEEDYVNNITNLVESSSLRENLISKGLAQAKGFTPILWAKNTAELYV